MMTRTPSEDLGVVTVSAGAGRLLFALLLSPEESSDELSRLANVPRKRMPALISDLRKVAVHPPDPVNTYSKEPVETLMRDSIPQWYGKEPRSNYLDPEDEIEVACTKADQSGDIKAQALVVIEAWKFRFPNVNKVQELRTQKAKEWVKAAGSASTVYGWMSGVEESKLATLDFPLAYVNKVILGKAAEAKPVVPEPESEGVPEEWRNYAQKMIEKGETSRGSKNIQGHLARITRAVQNGPGQP